MEKQLVQWMVLEGTLTFNLMIRVKIKGQFCLLLAYFYTVFLRNGISTWFLITAKLLDGNSIPLCQVAIFIFLVKGAEINP